MTKPPRPIILSQNSSVPDNPHRRGEVTRLSVAARVLRKIARLVNGLPIPLPVQRLSIFLIFGARASKKVEHWRARLCGKQRKSTASGQGEGSEMDISNSQFPILQRRGRYGTDGDLR